MSIASVMPSSHLTLWHPLLLPSIFPSIRDFSNESSVHIRWPKYQSWCLWLPNFEYNKTMNYTLYKKLKKGRHIFTFSEWRWRETNKKWVCVWSRAGVGPTGVWEGAGFILSVDICLGLSGAASGRFGLSCTSVPNPLPAARASGPSDWQWQIILSKQGPRTIPWLARQEHRGAGAGEFFSERNDYEAF